MDVMENIRLVLTKNMKVLRKARKLNQEQLAEKSGLSTGFIKDVERGHSWVSPESLEAISRGLGVEVGDLFATGQPEKVIQYPTSHLMARMIAAIPSEIYEKALRLPADEKEAWDIIEGILDEAIAAAKPEGKKA